MLLQLFLVSFTVVLRYVLCCTSSYGFSRLCQVCHFRATSSNLLNASKSCRRSSVLRRQSGSLSSTSRAHVFVWCSVVSPRCVGSLMFWCVAMVFSCLLSRLSERLCYVFFSVRELFRCVLKFWYACLVFVLANFIVVSSCPRSANKLFAIVMASAIYWTLEIIRYLYTSLYIYIYIFVFRCGTFGILCRTCRPQVVLWFCLETHSLSLSVLRVSSETPM